MLLGERRSISPPPGVDRHTKVIVPSSRIMYPGHETPQEAPYRISPEGIIYTAEDKKFMQLASREARLSVELGNKPVGAVLVAKMRAANGEGTDRYVIVGHRGNRLKSNEDAAAHAEDRILTENSAVIRSLVDAGCQTAMYVAYECCLG